MMKNITLHNCNFPTPVKAIWSNSNFLWYVINMEMTYLSKKNIFHSGPHFENGKFNATLLSGVVYD